MQVRVQQDARKAARVTFASLRTAASEEWLVAAALPVDSLMQIALIRKHM
jgi:hypothetical protein